MKYKIYLSPPTLNTSEIDSCQVALQSGWVSTVGMASDEFSQQLTDYFNSPTLLTNSGTSALHLALILAGVQENDLVLCSNFTFAASAFPILYQKAQPVFIGIEKQTWNCPISFLEEAILQLPQKPKALVLTHVYGMPADLDAIVNFCNHHNIILIEDAAEALGATYSHKKVGSFGAFGVISFNGNKIITTSSGGVLICKTNQEEELALKLASQSKENKPYYWHHAIGYNYKMSNILAAIGSAQFEKLDAFVTKRREIFNTYQMELSQWGAIEYQEENDRSFSNRWLSSFVFEPKMAETIQKTLFQSQIESRKLFTPLHTLPVFQKYEYFGDEYESKLFQQGLSLPSGNALSQDQQWEIIKLIKNTL